MTPKVWGYDGQTLNQAGSSCLGGGAPPKKKGQDKQAAPEPPRTHGRRSRAEKAIRGDATREYEEAIAAAANDNQFYVLRLYITGSTPRSASAIMTIRRLCEEHLKGRYNLEVVDIYQQPVLAKGEQIIAAQR